jgi:hypothetical protein
MKSFGDFLHYTLNTSDAAFLMNREGDVFTRIIQWVNTWKNGAFMVRERLPEFLLKESPVFRGGLGVMYSQLEKGWSFDIIAYAVPVLPHTANELLWEEDTATHYLFRLQGLLSEGVPSKLRLVDLKYPCLLTCVNVGLMADYTRTAGLDYTQELFVNYAVLEQAIAIGLINKGGMTS